MSILSWICGVGLMLVWLTIGKVGNDICEKLDSIQFELESIRKNIKSDF